MKIKTQQFINLLNKASKGVGNNKFVPITSMMSIKVEDNQIELHTTDGTNHLYVYGECEPSEALSVTVPATKFSTLIAKMTCETVELTLIDGNLEVRGNGKYIIELPVDESGKLVEYPNPLSKYDTSFIGTEFKKSDFVTIKNALGPALATTLEIPCYCNYFFGNGVVATDTYKIAYLNKNLLTNILLSSELINLLTIADCDDIKCTIFGNDIVFVTKDIVVYGHLADGLDDYSIDAIDGLIKDEFPYECKITKDSLLSALDRTALFVDVYDKNAIQLRFDNSELTITSKRSHSEETISYVSDINLESAFTCSIDVDILTSQLKSYVDDTVTIQFGKESSIKFVSADTIQILALLED